jgi:type IV fimbrial biogenesis protein FimT
MHKKLNVGFTLIELLVTLAVVGIALGAAVPSFNAMIARNRMATQTNDVLLAINMARSEALKIGSTVSFQAVQADDFSDDDTLPACTASNEFCLGWCIVEANPGDCSGTIIRRFEALPTSMRLNSVENVSSIQINGIGGLTNMGGGTQRRLDLCDTNGNGRRVFINLIGRSKSHRPDDAVTAKRPSC